MIRTESKVNIISSEIIINDKDRFIDMIGDKIKACRQSLGLNQADFARKIGIRQGYLSEIERNVKKPGGNVVLSLARLFPDFRHDFVADTDEKQPLNGRTEEIKRRFKVEDDEGYYRSGPAYLVPAIGPLQTPEKIKEGDVLGIEPDATPEDGDFVLVKTDVGPQIKRWTPGEPIIGVVTLLTRRRETLRQ